MHPFWQIFDAFFWVCKGVDWDEQRASSPLQGMLSAQILGVVYNNQHWNALCSNVQNTLLFAKCDWVLRLGDWDVESLTNDCQSQVRGQIYIVQKQKTGLRVSLMIKGCGCLFVMLCDVINVILSWRITFSHKGLFGSQTKCFIANPILSDYQCNQWISAVQWHWFEYLNI